MLPFFFQVNTGSASHSLFNKSETLAARKFTVNFASVGAGWLMLAPKGNSMANATLVVSWFTFPTPSGRVWLARLKPFTICDKGSGIGAELGSTVWALREEQTNAHRSKIIAPRFVFVITFPLNLSDHY